MNLAFIATGFIAHNYAQESFKMPDVKIVGVVDVNEEVGRAFAEQYGSKYYPTVEDLFANEKVDMVNICLPTNLHKEYVIKCANLGAHVLCEKPFTFKTEDCLEMEEACKKAGVRFMIAQVLRFWPEYIKCKEIIDSGELGEIELANLARMSAFPRWSKFYDTPSMSGGGVYDMHLHDVDFACHLFGDVKKVYAIGYKNDRGAWNNVVSNLTFKNGVSACITAGEEMSDNYPFCMNLRCLGTKGTVEFNYVAGKLLRSEPVTTLKKYMNGAEEEEDITIPEGNGYYNENRYFIDCVENNKPFDVVPIWDSTRSIGVIEAIVRSLETGEVIEIN